MHQPTIVRAVCAVALLVAAPWGWSQDRIYRCGNEYTNNAAVAKQRNCHVIEGGSVTVVHTQRSSGSASSLAGASSSSAAAPRVSRGPAGTQVDAGQQQARDNDARAILQAELTKAQDRLNTLLAEYNNGQPAKTELENSKPELYEARVNDLKSKITRLESDVQGIERELKRLPGG